MQLGYDHGEEIAEAAAAQLRSIPYTTNWSTATPTAIELATELARRAPGDISHAFFCGGGSEAVESAWKIVRQHFVQKGEPQRHKVIARRIAYHGVSLGALAISGVDGYKAPFGPPALEVRHVANTNRYRQPEGDDDAAFTARLLAEIEAVIEQEGPETIAMISVEPIQNAGGCFTPPEGYWQGLREICDRNGIMLHADEVISGFGRLGEIFGVTRYGGVPDVITLAKGLTSGHVPMGAVMLSERIVDVLREPGCTLMHGLTFGGHPVCAAVAMKSLEIYDREDVLEGVRSRVPFLGELMRGLLEIPAVGDVRGDGFFWAAEIVADEEGSPLDGRREAALRRRGHAAPPARPAAHRPRRRPRRRRRPDRAGPGGGGRRHRGDRGAPRARDRGRDRGDAAALRLGEGGDHLGPVGLERPLGRVVHEVDRELVHARVAQLLELRDVGGRLAQDAEAVDDLVGDELACPGSRRGRGASSRSPCGPRRSR